MRIGIDARYLGIANSALARYSELLLQALSRLDEENLYTVFVNDQLKRKLKLRENFHVRPLRGHPMSLNGMRRIRRAVRQENLDLLHVHFPLTPPLADCPTLITVHDVLPFSREGRDFGFRLRPKRWLWSYLLYPLALRRAKWVICVSHSTRGALVRLFPEMFHKTIVVRSGVNDVFRKPVEPATLDLVRSRLNLPERYVLYSGSARSDKNIDVMLKIFSMLRQRNEMMKDLYWVLELTGDQPQESIERLIAQYNLIPHVRILRNLGEEERRTLFEDASAFCLLSKSEGFCFPVLEAQLCGVPVLAADAGALPEVAGPQGAVFVDPEKPEETLALLEQVLTDVELRAYLKTQGRRNAEQYEWTGAARQLLQIFEHLFFPRDQLRLSNQMGPMARMWEWIQY